MGTAEFKVVACRVKVEQIKFNLMYRIVIGSAPKYLQNDLNYASQTHRYTTRHSASSLCITSVKSAGKNYFYLHCN